MSEQDTDNDDSIHLDMADVVTTFNNCDQSTLTSKCHKLLDMADDAGVSIELQNKVKAALCHESAFNQVHP